MARRRRVDSEYEIEAVTNGIKVIEALEGTRFEPVNVAAIIERTELSRDTVTRTLRTLRLHGYAIEEKRRWTIGKRFMRFAARIAAQRGETL